MTVRTGVDMGDPGALNVSPSVRLGTDEGVGVMNVYPKSRQGAYQFTTQAGYKPRTEHAMEVIDVTQNIAVTVSVFMRDADNDQGRSGLTLIVKSKKAGSDFSTISPAQTNRSVSGWYDLSFTGPMVDTLGAMPLNITANTGVGQAAVQPNNSITLNVIAINKNDAVHAGLSSLPNAAAGTANGLPLESEVAAIHTDTTSLITTTTAIHSDTAAIHADTTSLLSTTAAIHADTTSLLSAAAAILDDTSNIKKAAFGRWKILNKQLILYDDDGTTPIATFNLKDKNGAATDTSIFERVPV